LALADTVSAVGMNNFSTIPVPMSLKLEVLGKEHVIDHDPEPIYNFLGAGT
jgi:hypothetical protein